jgi:BirA family transcriptional regulator, biotin operon repressor / biotin---[acetyl-CoA-carboxylase] ligase
MNSGCCSLLKFLSTTKRNSICKRVFFYDVAESTQDIAISLAETNSNLDRTLIIANEQSGGKGRDGKIWISPRGGIWLSIIIRPYITVNKVSFLSFIASLSVCEAIRAETGLESNIKWPNDIVINSKKVSGILISIGAENAILKYLVCGIGINSNLDNTSLHLISKTIGAAYEITSLRNEMSGNYIDCGNIIVRILQKLDYYLEQLESNELLILDDWKVRCETINKNVRIVNKDHTWYEGLVLDVDLDGSLIVKVANGNSIRVTENEVTIRTTTI